MEKSLLRSHEAKKITLQGFGVNAALTFFKLIAGIYGKSNAMIADGIHSLSDFFTDLVVLLGFKFTEKPEDECHNYGHGKYETLVTIIVSIFLAAAGLGILRSSALCLISIINGNIIPPPGWIAFAAAAISILGKELLYRYTIKAGEKINSSAVIANAWHHRSDAFSSIGTFIGIGGSIILGAGWRLLDPLASVIVSIFIFKVAYDIFLPAINELLESALSKKECEHIVAIIKNCEGAKDYHNLRTRRIGPNVAIEFHILVDQHLSITAAHDTVTEIEERLKKDFGKMSIITIHIEPLPASHPKFGQ